MNFHVEIEYADGRSEDHIYTGVEHMAEVVRQLDLQNAEGLEIRTLRNEAAKNAGRE